MQEVIKNVNVETKANIYFDGKVTSRNLILGNGSKVTLGVILPGEYIFGVGDKEIVEITNGCAYILFPDEADWLEVNTGEEFTVKSNSNYKIKCDDIVEYICFFVKV